MRKSMIVFFIGHILRIEGLLLALPLICALIYGENVMPFVVPMVFLIVFGTAISLRPPQTREFTPRDSLITVGLCWILLSLFGAVPMFLCGYGISFADCFFETVSGFTTTGATILGVSVRISALPKGILFWRSFTHWIGGMGVLVFMLAVLPGSDMRSTKLMHLMRAEIPGPMVDKIVSKIKHTARILYGIYLGLTVIEIVMLLFGGMPLYDSLLNAFGTAGTGGFTPTDNSIEAYDSSYLQWVVGVFMLLFGVNFNVYYLILTGQVLRAFKSEELRCYLGIVGVSTLIIGWNIYSMYSSVSEVARHSFFQVASIITTSGFATTDFNLWPNLSKAIIVLLMFCGACTGSTGGGIKIGRLMMLVKNGIREMRYSTNPHEVISVRFEGKRVSHETLRGTTSFMIIYTIIFIVSFLLITLIENADFVTGFTGVATCINNVGPGLGDIIGPAGSFGSLSELSKVILSFDMLAGRLEIYPILMLFSPRVWRMR